MFCTCFWLFSFIMWLSWPSGFELWLYCFAFNLNHNLSHSSQIHHFYSVETAGEWKNRLFFVNHFPNNGRNILAYYQSCPENEDATWKMNFTLEILTVFTKIIYFIPKNKCTILQLLVQLFLSYETNSFIHSHFRLKIKEVRSLFFGHGSRKHKT